MTAMTQKNVHRNETEIVGTKQKKEREINKRGKNGRSKINVEK